MLNPMRTGTSGDFPVAAVGGVLAGDALGAWPRPMTREFMRRAHVLQPSSDPDEAALETVGLMTGYIKDSARDPLVRMEAAECLSRFRGGPLLSMSGLDLWDPRLPAAAREQAMAECCYWWAKHNLEFVHHSRLLGAWLGKSDALQLLVSPDVVIHALRGPDKDAALRARQGDCAIYSPVICALLEALGLEWELVIAAVDREQPKIFSHIWPRAVLSDGRRVSLDASHGPYCGWHVPARDIFRLQVFDCDGRVVEDKGGTFEGFGEYLSVGLGQTDAAGDTTVNLGELYPAGMTTIGVPQEGGGVTPVPITTAPGSGSGFNWDATLANLLNQWTQIGGRVIAPQTTYSVGPSGQISYATPGAAPVPSGISTPIGSGTVGWLAIGALGLVAFIAIMGSGRGK